MHVTEPIVPEPSTFEVELAIEKLKSHKSPGTDQIPAELIKAGSQQFTMKSNNLLFLFGIRWNFLRSGRNRSLYLSIRRAMKQIVVIIAAYQFSNYIQNSTQHSPVKVNSICRRNYWGSSMWILMQQANY